MYDESKKIIESLMSELERPKRKTTGQDRSKNYHKVTISMTEKAKQELIDYVANPKNEVKSVSQLIKDMLKAEGIISET